MKPRLKVHR